MLTSRFKQTKAYAELSSYPPMVLEDLAEVAGRRGIDLNSVKQSENGVVVGEPRTGLCVTVTPNHIRWGLH